MSLTTNLIESNGRFKLQTSIVSLVVLYCIKILESSLLSKFGYTKFNSRLSVVELEKLNWNLYFEIITTIAIVVGLVAANVFQPGAGIDMSSLTQVDISKYAETTHQVSEAHHGLIQTILSVIPSNFFAALTSGQMLPIIFFSVMFGIGLGALDREVKQPLHNVLNAVEKRQVS